jgi:hypothetical protein
MSSEEADYIPNQKLSSGMLSRHPDRNHQWKEGHDGQAGCAHGQGGAQVQGVAHQHGQEDEDCGEETGAGSQEITSGPATAAFVTIYKWGEHHIISIAPNRNHNTKKKTS